jgi:hypothetical protein
MTTLTKCWRELSTVLIDETDPRHLGLFEMQQWVLWVHELDVWLFDIEHVNMFATAKAVMGGLMPILWIGSDSPTLEHWSVDLSRLC